MHQREIGMRARKWSGMCMLYMHMYRSACIYIHSVKCVCKQSCHIYMYACVRWHVDLKGIASSVRFYVVFTQFTRWKSLIFCNGIELYIHDDSYLLILWNGMTWNCSMLSARVVLFLFIPTCVIWDVSAFYFLYISTFATCLHVKMKIVSERTVWVCTRNYVFLIVFCFWDVLLCFFVCERPSIKMQVRVCVAMCCSVLQCVACVAVPWCVL